MKQQFTRMETAHTSFNTAFAGCKYIDQREPGITGINIKIKLLE
jgi:hypothetical protein